MKKKLREGSYKRYSHSQNADWYLHWNIWGGQFMDLPQSLPEIPTITPSGSASVFKKKNFSKTFDYVLGFWKKQIFRFRNNIFIFL